MFATRLLYNPNNQHDDKFAFYNAVLCYVCTNVEAGQVAGIKTLLGLDTLAIRSSGVYNHYRYLVAGDATGLQIFFAPQRDYQTTWRGVTNEPLLESQLMGGKVLASIKRDAAALMDDFFVYSPPNAAKKYFVGGHGLPAAIATMFHFYLKDKAYTASQVYGGACPKFENEACCLGMEAAEVECMHYYYSDVDTLAEMPPSLLWSRLAILAGVTRIEELHLRGTVTTCRGRTRNIASERRLVAAMQSAGTVNDWPDAIAAGDNVNSPFYRLIENNSPAAYVAATWDKMRLNEQDQCDELQAVMNTTFGWNLVKRT